MVAARRKTIDELMEELHCEEESQLVDRIMKWPKKDIAKWLVFHLMAKGRMAYTIPEPALMLPILYQEYYGGLCEFALLIKEELDASQQSKSVAAVQN